MLVDRKQEITKLFDIVNANWSDQYLSETGEIKYRCCLWRLAKVLHLENWDFIRNLFPQVDLHKARQAVFVDIQKVVQIDDQNSNDRTDDLLRCAVHKVNLLIRYANDKRFSSEPVALIPTPVRTGVEIVDEGDLQESEEVEIEQQPAKAHRKQPKRLTKQQRQEIQGRKQQAKVVTLEKQDK